MADALDVKIAHNDHPLLDVIRRRWSGRTFDGRELPRATLAACLEAARWAPSSGNKQPWRFLVADRRDAQVWAEAEACLNEGNAWAKKAAVLVVGVAKELDDEGKPYRYGRHDLGLASENLMLQAFALGLTVHAMGGFSADEVRKRFGVPDGFEPISVIALGYPGEVSALDDKHRARELAPRERKPLGEIAFEGAWEKAFRP